MDILGIGGLCDLLYIIQFVLFTLITLMMACFISQLRMPFSHSKVGGQDATSAGDAASVYVSNCHKPAVSTQLTPIPCELGSGKLFMVSHLWVQLQHTFGAVTSYHHLSRLLYVSTLQLLVVHLCANALVLLRLITGN